jgi:hypothetical protein
MAEGILKYRVAVRDSRCGSIAGSYHAKVSSYAMALSLLARLTDRPQIRRPATSSPCNGPLLLGIS